MAEWVSFSEIKARVSLGEVLRAYRVDWLRRSGRDQFRGRCPIHRGEGREAFHANLVRNLFHCFACGAGGNVLDFVVAMENCSVREAALRLQNRAGCGHPGAAPDFHGRTAERAPELVTKKREVNQPLGFSLTVNGAHPYLAARGIDPPTAGRFGVGFFAGRGLMSGRMVIPIHDEQGRLIAYCGRTIDGRLPRYRFPAGFHKSGVLFNYHRALAVGSPRVIVVEGFFDCMRVHQAGYPCVVALMGAALYPAQKELLAGRFSEAVLLLDGDETGRAATAGIAHQLRSTCAVSQVQLELGLQPDQMSPHQIREILIAAERREQSIADCIN
jgi:DNA primase